MLLSIIIPVYNIQDYVARCLDSCLNQNLPLTEYEIIAVDDGSTDGSADIIRPYLEKYPNVKYVYQANQGLSGARNTGMDHASGDYVWFVDGDDFIKENCLKEIANFVHAADCDIFTFGYLRKMHEQEIFKTFPVTADRVMTGCDFLQQYPHGISACLHWYNRNFLQNNHLRFVLHLLYEDAELNLRAFFIAQKVIYHQDCYYFYDCTRSASITHQNLTRQIQSMIESDKRAQIFFADKKLSPELRYAILQRRMESAVRFPMRLVAHPGVPYDEILKYAKDLRKIVREIPGEYVWKIAFLLPLSFLCRLAKVAYFLRPRRSPKITV